MEKKNRFKAARTEHNQHGPQSAKEVVEATGITKSLIGDVESTAGTPRDVGYLKIKKLAQHYGVSSDYLLGLSDTPSVKEDTQVACKTTGLSESAIQALTGSKQIREYNFLLTSESFGKFVNLISLYNKYRINMAVDDMRHESKMQEAAAKGNGYIDLRMEWKQNDAERRGIKAELIEAVFELLEEIDSQYEGLENKNGKH